MSPPLRITRRWSITAGVCLAVLGLIALGGCGGSGTPSSPAPGSSSTKAEPATSAVAQPAPVAKPAESTSAAPVAAGWGTLRGKFVFDGKPAEPSKIDVNKDVDVCGKHNLVNEELVVDKDGGIANVVIYVRDKSVKVHPDLAKFAQSKPVCDNRGCRFEPHIIGVLVSQVVELHNSDAVAHNMNLQPIGDSGANPLIPPGGAIDHTFNRPQSIPVPVTCNIHPWMKGYILPRDNPYFAVTKPDGSFEIANLPSGELEFQAWQEKCGYLALDGWEKGRFKLTIQPGDNDLGVKKVPAAVFAK